MSVVHLVGGGRDDQLLAPIFERFVADAATAASADRPRVHALLVLEGGEDAADDRFCSALHRAGADLVVHAIVEGETFTPAAIDGAAALAVGGGLTPAYAAAVAPIAVLIRERVEAGAPYLGFSAGAAIAAEHALVGGYLLDGVEVCDAAAGEELGELTMSDGLGLVPFTVDVHAAQWGTVSRLVAAVQAGLALDGFAIDEHTAVVQRQWGEPEIGGAGAAWYVGGGGFTVADLTVRRLLPPA
ncbi:Type 1 glutamine amidotransferase-like domain-containing protein [Microbacterium sp. P04]|uniref:Type 1 glutamine amidotransferase-like domain-containing protein n=1 Tax=Microbacterium sp. P04 TaxID=3366947 RepID=UPI003745F485